VRNHDTVIVVKDGDITDPKVRNAGPGTEQWRWYKWHSPLYRDYPGYAVLDTLVETEHAGFTRTTMRDFLGGTTWHRNVFWLKGRYFVLIDEIVPKEDGTYYAECNFHTFPKAKRSYPRMTPKTFRLLPGRRGFEISFDTPGKTRLYAVTDGTCDEVTTDTVYPQYITTQVVRQVRRAKKLAAGEKLTYINLFFGDRESDRQGYRVERIGPCEALVFQGNAPAAYFGTAQTANSRAVLPIEAKMFLVTRDTIALTDGTSAGDHFRSEVAVSREITLRPQEADRALSSLSHYLAATK